MTPLIEVTCPSCATGYQLPYNALGREMNCPQCGVSTIPQVKADTVIPDTGYALRFSDFLELVRVGDREVAGMLQAWFGVRSAGEEEGTVMTEDGRLLDLFDLHLEIQDDPARQKSLYQAAMSRWR